MDAAMKRARLEDRVRGDLFDLTDGADWPQVPEGLEEIRDNLGAQDSLKMDDELHEWRREIVKAAVAEIVNRVGENEDGWLKILSAVIREESETIVQTLEESEDVWLGHHDTAMLETYADPYGPDHPGYEVRERSTAQADGLVTIRDGIAARVGSGCAAVMVEYVTGGAPSCPLVSITLPLSDARELAK